MRRAILLSILMFNTWLLAQGYKPKAGFVPDSVTAIKVAEAVLTPIYGEKQVESKRPFLAVQCEGVWTVTGASCPDARGGTTTMGCRGGSVTIQIAKNDARILTMEFGK